MVLDEEKFQEEISSVISQEEELIGRGVTVAVYTRRKLLSLEHDSPEEALVRSVRISDAVQSLVGRLKVRPAFVVAKGGITSSDVGTKALQVSMQRSWDRSAPAYRYGAQVRRAVFRERLISYSPVMWGKWRRLRRRWRYCWVILHWPRFLAEVQFCGAGDKDKL